VVVAVLFAIGSTCFLVGALASQSSSVTRPGIAITFFAGSIFFTSAAYLQHWLSARAVMGRPPLREREHLHLARPDTWPNAHVDALATLIQLAGTLLFNLNTYNAMDASLPTMQANLRVWTPDNARLCLLPRRERTGVRERLARLSGVQTPLARLVDQRGEPARLDRLRRGRARLADPALDERAGRRRDRERRHRPRRARLPDRRAPAAARRESATRAIVTTRTPPLKRTRPFANHLLHGLLAHHRRQPPLLRHRRAADDPDDREDTATVAASAIV
jgi:hypothetical protein